jgi:mannose-6-phosphate isomerase-like protein (cupin superfamily)
MFFQFPARARNLAVSSSFKLPCAGVVTARAKLYISRRESIRKLGNRGAHLRLAQASLAWQHLRMPGYLIAHLDEIEPVKCPCGWARRALATRDNGLATVHQVDIQADARTHYHKATTEIYVVLEGEGRIELDGVPVPLRPMTVVMIKPGCRHRAIGKLKILNIAIPPFDETDEWFD